jgi:hypothetical protein
VVPCRDQKNFGSSGHMRNWTLKDMLEVAVLVYNNLEVNNMINLLYKVLFMNWIFKRYFVFLSIIEFMNHFEFMTRIVKLHNIEYTLKSH